MELITEEKKGLKRTDVGLIPEDWEVKSMGDLLVRSELGGNYSNSEELTENPLIKMGNLDRGSINLSKVEYVKNDNKVSEKHLLKKGDLLFNTRNTPQLVGKIAVWRNELKKAYYNSNLLKLEFDESYISSNFFMNYLLNTEYFIEKLSSIATGTTSVAAIYTRDLYKLDVPVPPTEEQQAIASTLSDVDELIRSLDGLIQKKQAIKKGTMQQLLTGKKRLPGFDGEWEVKALGECFDFLKTGTQSRSALNSYGDIGYIHYGDIHSKWDLFLDCDNQKIPKIDSDKVKSLPQLQEGDLIIADASEDYEGVGKSIEIKNISGKKIVAGLHTMLMRAKNELLADGYKAYITSIESVKKKLAQIATGTTVYGLSKTKLKEVEIYLPKSIEEQKAIAQILSDMDRELQTLRQMREKYVQIKQGMMQQLLTGRIRIHGMEG